MGHRNRNVIDEWGGDTGHAPQDKEHELLGVILIAFDVTTGLVSYGPSL